MKSRAQLIVRLVCDTMAETKSNSRLPATAFIDRPSPLTELLKNNPDVRSLYNLIAALVICQCLTRLNKYINNTQLIVEDVEFFQWAFGNMQTALLIWSLMVLLSVAGYFLTKFIRSANLNVKFSLAVYYTITTLVPLHLVNHNDLSCVWRFALLCEQTRLLMKNHSFFAEYLWMEEANESMKKASFKDFAFFLLVPALIFRTEYPRSKERSWYKVASYGVQFCATVMMAFLTIPQHCQTYFRYYGLPDNPVKKSVVGLILESVYVGTTTHFIVFYGMLHCWMNMWAEILRFADRQFYDTWWHLDTYSRYYRQWNLIVHNWLHAYVYQEVQTRSGGNKSVAATMTILFSAVFHEYIITTALGAFYPVLFALYAGLGVMLYFLSLRFSDFEKIFGNIFLFFSLFLGYAVQTVFYSSEYYARINCPPQRDWFWDKLIPRSWSC
ncbi:Sterol O-acyltransferase 2 [Halotydeus destructor]|nr:Sterol O-acyltransferase 2 [Halotydeus destructor]